MKRAIARSSAVLLTLLLQSCGGGGSGGGGSAGPPPPPPPPPPPSGLLALTRGNAVGVGQVTFASATDGLQVMDLLSETARILNAQLLVEEVIACTQSGTVRLSALDRNSNGVLNPTDRVLITYTACNDSVTGTLVLDVSAITFGFNGIVTLDGAVTFDLEFIGAPPAFLSGSGDLSYQANATELSWLGTDFTVIFAFDGESDSLTNGHIEKVITADPELRYAITLSGSIDSDFLEGTYTFATQPPLVGDEGWWPETGRLTATGRGNSQVSFRTLTFIQGGAGYEVDADGNGVIDDVATAVDWDEIAFGFMFGVPDDDNIPQPPNPGPDILGRTIALGAPGEDLLVDRARGKFYVTIPDRNELLVFSAQTLEVVQRVHLASRPSGMSMSADGEEIFVGLRAASSIAVIDADTFAISHIFVATELESSRVYDVVETAPGILYAGTGIARTDGRFARVDRASGVITPVGPTGMNFGRIELLADPARGVLYVGDDLTDLSPTLRKYDATNPQTPLQLQLQNGAIGPTHRLSLDPTGTRIYTSGGEVLNASNFSLIGRIFSGTPWASDNGADVMVAGGAGTLNIFNAADLRLIESLDSDCALGRSPSETLVNVDRLAQSSVAGQWLMLGGAVLCAIDLNNRTVPPGTGQPGVQPVPLPVTNVQGIRVTPGGTIFDGEFDEIRNRLYVTVPSTGEVITIDAATRQIIERDVLGNLPRGLDLSPDGSTLAIMFNGNGNIGFKNLTSGLTEMRDLTSFLGTTFGNDVAWVSDDAIFATADPPCCDTQAFLVRTSRIDPDATRRSSTENHFQLGVTLTASPDGNFLYVTRPGSKISKLDLSLPNEPVVRITEPDEMDGGLFQSGGQSSVSPDGERIARIGGNVFRTSDLFMAGHARPRGTAMYSPDGLSLYIALGGNFIDRFNPTTFEATQRYASACPSDPSRMLSNAAGNRIIAISQIHACFWLMDQPSASALKVKPQSLENCNTACLLREYERRSGSGGSWSWRPVERPNN